MYAQVPEHYMGLVYIPAGLVDHVDAGLRFMRRSGDLARVDRVCRPAIRQGFVEPPNHVLGVKIPRHREEYPPRIEATCVEFLHRFPRDRLDGGLRRLNGGEVVTVSESAKLP